MICRKPWLTTFGISCVVSHFIPYPNIFSWVILICISIYSSHMGNVFERIQWSHTLHTHFELQNFQYIQRNCSINIYFQLKINVNNLKVHLKFMQLFNCVDSLICQPEALSLIKVAIQMGEWFINMHSVRLPRPHLAIE